jgi:large subunit ribosomal protein L23
MVMVAKGNVTEAKPRISMYKNLIKPVVTEKTSRLGDVVLEVHPDMDKIQIRQAVEAVFSVKVKSVRTINKKGKLKGAYGKYGHRKDRKKAYITLMEGHHIDLFEEL